MNPNTHCPLNPNDIQLCTHPAPVGICASCGFDFDVKSLSPEIAQNKKIKAQQSWADSRPKVVPPPVEDGRVKTLEEALRTQAAALRKQQAEIEALLAAAANKPPTPSKGKTGAKTAGGIVLAGAALFGAIKLWPVHEKNVPKVVLMAPESSMLPEPGRYIPPQLVYEKGDEIGSIEFDGGATPPMILIPAGEFKQGSPSTEKGRYGDEGTAPRTVTIAKPFAVSKYEITRAEFAKYAAAHTFRPDKQCKWDSPGFEQTGNHPVVCVSWNDAKGYAAWLSAKTGLQFRLLTESEWEYAARGDGEYRGQRRYWGNDENDDQACKFANVSKDGFKCDDGYRYTSPVGSFKPNSFGLYDTLGNAWEWVEDCKANYSKAATDSKAAVETEGCSRVLRGGSWFSLAQDVRATNRDGFSPDNRSFYVGFRLARTLN
jgi:formylglycine-generating enzyme required for sulfatase activity